jgi:hypothetical protein
MTWRQIVEEANRYASNLKTNKELIKKVDNKYEEYSLDMLK